MKIKFNQKHKSIAQFDEIDIKDFSIFLGVNGSGKTHLLKAMQDGFISADKIVKEAVSYFNLQTFLIKNQRAITPRHLEDEKLQAWNILESRRQQFQVYDKNLKAIAGEQENPIKKN
jgi:ABC-type cobalamin/Fe3+-siderophores transport system ATPase subunit